MDDNAVEVEAEVEAVAVDETSDCDCDRGILTPRRSVDTVPSRNFPFSTTTAVVVVLVLVSVLGVVLGVVLVLVVRCNGNPIRDRPAQPVSTVTVTPTWISCCGGGSPCDDMNAAVAVAVRVCRRVVCMIVSEAEDGMVWYSMVWYVTRTVIW
jgi:hypothetical protein